MSAGQTKILPWDVTFHASIAVATGDQPKCRRCRFSAATSFAVGAGGFAMAARKVSRSLPVNTMRSHLPRVGLLLRRRCGSCRGCHRLLQSPSESTAKCRALQGAGPIRPNRTLGPKNTQEDDVRPPYLVEKGTIFVSRRPAHAPQRTMTVRRRWQLNLRSELAGCRRRVDPTDGGAQDPRAGPGRAAMRRHSRRTDDASCCGAETAGGSLEKRRSACSFPNPIKERSFLTKGGPFKLASGATERLLPGHEAHDVLSRRASASSPKSFFGMLRDDPDVDSIGGLELGAVPIVSAGQHALEARASVPSTDLWFARTRRATQNRQEDRWQFPGPIPRWCCSRT